MKHYEVIIIGAGLAGCVLGYLLRKQGKSVLLVEKNDSMQKSKLCGGVVTKKAYQLLSEFYPHHQLDFTTYSSCFIHNADKTLEVPATLYTIPRKDLDDFVLREYLKFGGEIIDKTCYSMLDIYINTIIIDNVIYTFDYLVGADGVLSQVRKDVTGKMQSINFALEDTLSRKAGQAKLEISFFDSFTGYAWTIPNNRCTMVGIGEVSGKMDLKADYHRYLNEIQMYADDKKGALLPTGKDILLEMGDNVRFVGDAAGLISPITGEGIYYALVSAKVLSEDFVQYEANMTKVVRQIKKEHLLKLFVFNHNVRNFLFKWYGTNVGKWMVDKVFSKIT